MNTTAPPTLSSPAPSSTPSQVHAPHTVTGRAPATTLILNNGSEVIHTLAHHLKALSLSTAAAQRDHAATNTKTGSSIVASLLSFTTRRSSATATTFQPRPVTGSAVPILTAPAPPPIGRFAPRPQSIVAATIHSTTTSAATGAARASRYEAAPSLAPMNTVTLAAGAGGASTMIPGPTTRLTLDPMHLAYLEHRFRTSPRVRKYLGLPPMPSGGAASNAGGAGSSGWGIGSWFGRSSTAPSSASAAEDQQLLYIFQCFEQLRSLRLTPVAKRPIADWPPAGVSPTSAATTTSLHNLTSIEFKGVVPSSVDLSELCMQVTVMAVQSHVESLDQVLTYPSYTRLSLLDLSSNALTMVDAEMLARAPHLADLVLHANQLVSFPDISPLAHLTHLDLSFNQITSLPSADCPTPHSSLQRLNLHANRLMSLDSLPRQFPNLIQLVASKNLLANIPPLAQLASLADVQLWGNPVQELDEVGYRVQIAAQFSDRVEHVVVDGQRLVPLPPMPGQKKRGGPAGVKPRVVTLEGDQGAQDNTGATSPKSQRGKRSPLASQVDLAQVKEEDDPNDCPPPARRQQVPLRTNSDPTLRRATASMLGGGTTAVDATLAEERIRRKIDELKRQGGAQNWMRHMVHEAAGRHRPPTGSDAIQAGPAPTDVVAAEETTSTLAVATGVRRTASPIVRPRSTGSLKQLVVEPSVSVASSPTHTALPRLGHGRKPSTSSALAHAPPSHPPTNAPPPDNPSPTPPSADTSSPSLNHSDSGISSPPTTPTRLPPLPVLVAHHAKPSRTHAKRAALTYKPQHVSESLAELPLVDLVAARVVHSGTTCWAQLTCRVSRSAPLTYVTVKHEAAAGHVAEVAKRWVHVLARQLTGNQARGHLGDVCPRGECVVCGTSGWIADHVGKRRKLEAEVTTDEEEEVVQEVDLRQGAYLDVQLREHRAGGAKGVGQHQLECAMCGTVVAVYFGSSLGP